MATQLQFSRHAQQAAPRGSWDGSESSSLAWETSHRHVAFAVHDAVPSAQLYQQRYGERDERSAHNALNTVTWEEPSFYEPNKMQIIPQPMAKSAPPQLTRDPSLGRRNSAKALVTRRPVAKKATTPRAVRISGSSKPKPGWDSGGSSSSNLFDATLKKSVLFQPRPGDRLKEVKEEEQAIRGRTPTPVVAPRRTSSAWNSRIAKTLPAQPKRKPKDYVKMNMEKITGQRYETIVRRSQSATPNRSRGSVFERLSAPLLRQSTLRFRSLSPTRVETHPMRLPETREGLLPSPMKLSIASPVINDHVTHETQRSPPRARSSPSRPSTTSHSSPIRERGSTPSSTRRSPPSRGSSPGFRSDRSDSRRETNDMVARVFEVLDREGRQRIGVDQILDGLRLLQLPATHNQVADYVYLIHEGAVNTIDFEEWSILVGTLDAASGSAIASSRAPSVRDRSSPHRSSPPSIHDYSPSMSRRSARSSPPRSMNQVPSPPKSIPYDTHRDNRSWSPSETCASLSMKMPDSKMMKIARHSEHLADLVLEDLLLDTVEELNEDERVQAERKRHFSQAQTLDSILQQIHRIEEEEAELINNGFAMGYHIDGSDRVDEDRSETHTHKRADASQQVESHDNLVLPLGLIMSSVLGNDHDIDHEVGEPVQPLKHHDEARAEEREAFDTDESIACPVVNPSTSMACLSGKLFQSVEKNRVRFLKHRQLAESSLESTGMDQASVIELLADLVLDEISLECAVELESGVEDLTVTLARTLL